MQGTTAPLSLNAEYDPALPIHPHQLASRPLGFVWQVARGRYRGWLSLLAWGEAVHAACGILLPYALGRIVSAVAALGPGSELALSSLRDPLALFAALCAGELLLSRVNAALDRILVFAGGEIVENGTHAELLARGGAYQALWSRQSGGLLPDTDGASHAAQ